MMYVMGSDSTTTELGYQLVPCGFLLEDDVEV
jgi:hypothetical protein